jgi:hypothetical protein
MHGMRGAEVPGVVPLPHVSVVGLPRGGPVLALHILVYRIPFTRMWTIWTTWLVRKSRDSSNQ